MHKSYLICFLFVSIMGLESESQKEGYLMKYAIAYFSQTGTTAGEAEKLGHVLGVSPAKIQPVQAYTNADINWHDDSSRANREQNDESARPEIKPVSLGDYDVLFLGYPTWWGVAPRLIDTFIEQTNLQGKTLVPFATSGSTGPERGGARVKQLAKGADVKPAKRVNGFSESQLKDWFDSLNL